MNKIKILSFFSGGGFLDMGFEKAGFDIVWSNEYDTVFGEIYSQGLTSWAKSQGINKTFKISNNESIENINSKTIINEAFYAKPQIFGMIGGPPCQDFSLNGQRNGFDGERGKLTHIYINIILGIRPTFFLMENVPGLVGLKKAKPVFEKLIKELEQDYYVEKIKLNAIEYGVPQSRERIFVVGFLKNKIPAEYPPFKWPQPKYPMALKVYNWPKTNSFGKKIIKPDNIPIELCVQSCLKQDKETSANINEYFRFKNNKEKRLAIKEGDTNRQSFKRLHRFRYSPTTSYGNNEVHLHPYEDRRISVREALRIQGVPDTYVISGKLNMTKKFKVISNGVPVPLAFEIAKTIKSYIVENINGYLG